MVKKYFTIRTDTQTYSKFDILNEIDEIVEMLSDLGYDMNGKEYEVSSKMHAVNTWGKCRKLGNNRYCIYINPIVLKYATPEHVHQLIAHEVCHSLTGAKGHNNYWKMAGYRLSTAYGFKMIQRTENMPEVTKYLKDEKTISETHTGYKYIMTCENCGNETYYKRMNKYIRTAANLKGAKYKWIQCKCGCRKFGIKQLY